MIAETMIRWQDLRAYLQDIEAGDFKASAETEKLEPWGDALTEIAGRLCYRSWRPGMNANVTKVRQGSREYIGNVLKQRHGSVFEHASVSFIFHNVSRVFTHELVRHRAGCAISQESLRYVRLTDIGFRMPPCFQSDPELMDRATSLVGAMEAFQLWMANRFDLDGSKDFPFKKAITSAMRRLAPLGLSTGIMWTANHRTLRHVIVQRTAEGAEEEIRLVFDQVAQLMKERFPSIYQDFTRKDNNGTWFAENEKV